MLTSTGEYALRAMIHIAGADLSQYVLAHDIGAELEIPERYLSKILGTITRKGLLEARRGRGGGFRLSRASKAISLYEILDAVDRTGHFDRCLLGYQDCNDQVPCAMHKLWREFKTRILELLKSITLEDLATGRVSQEMAFEILKTPTAAV